MKKAVFITIGEAPRSDISKTFDKYFLGMDNVKQVGLLDELTYEEAIDLLGATQDEKHILTSRFVNGKSIVMDHKKVEERLQNTINGLEKETIDTICILCTGAFENIYTKKAELLEAEKVTVPFAKEKFQGKKIGIMVPLESQIEDSKNKWNLADKGTIVSASPYKFSKKEFKNATLALVNKKVDVIILDCMGYNSDITDYISIFSNGIEVIQSNEIFFKYIKEQVIK